MKTHLIYFYFLFSAICIDGQDNNQSYQAGKPKLIKRFSNFTKEKFIYTVDYTYSKKNQLKAGLEWVLYNSEGMEPNILFLGTGYGMVNYDGKIHGIPDLNLSYHLGTVLFLKTGTSFSYAYVVSGFSFLNALDCNFGYSHPFSSDFPVKGFTIGLTVRITNKDNIYGQINIMQ